MKRYLTDFTNRIKKTAFFMPFTIYFLVFVVVAFFAKNLINSEEFNSDSSFSDIFFLLVKVAIFFTFALLSISLIFVLVSWVHFIYKKRKTGIQLQVDTNKSEQDNEAKQSVQVLIKPILKPLLGFVKIRLQYDKKHFSEKFSLLEKSNKLFFANSIEGSYHWALPQIKEYRLDKAIVYFEDIFQFFSLAISLPVSNGFFSHPTANPTQELNASPRKTEETNTRIDQMRKVEGEFLNYKNFENNDDVRRIVWKIYAKNKELVVRIPEIMDPYASHAYLYASFFSHFSIGGNETVEIPFLNFYKTVTWSVYQSLVRQGFEVKYIPDQDVSKNNTADEQQWVKYAISTSKWHADKTLKDFVQPNNASVIIISSLSDVAQVKELAERHGNEIRFIFIKLTDSFRHQNIGDWLQWVFVKNEDQDLDVYKRKWAVSMLREKIKENERRLEECLPTLLVND